VRSVATRDVEPDDAEGLTVEKEVGRLSQLNSVQTQARSEQFPT
jgi:hypothetical protein